MLVQVGDRFAAGHQEIERDHVGAVAVAQLAGDVAVDAAVVDVVAAAEPAPGPARRCVPVRPGRGGRHPSSLFSKLALGGVGGIHGAIARAPPRPECCAMVAASAFFTCSGAQLKMQRGHQECGRHAPPARARRAAPTAGSGSRGSSATGNRILVRLGIEQVGNQNVVHAQLDQRLHVAVRHLHGIAGLRHGHLHAGGGDARIGRRRKHGLDAQLRQNRRCQNGKRSKVAMARGRPTRKRPWRRSWAGRRAAVDLLEQLLAVARTGPRSPACGRWPKACGTCRSTYRPSSSSGPR